MKNTLFIVALLLIIIVTSDKIIYAVPPPPFPGDVTGGGLITLADAIVAMRCINAENDPKTIYYTPPSYSDVNADGKIGIEEALYALQILAGLR